MCKSADLLLMVLDATKPWTHKEILTRELEAVRRPRPPDLCTPPPRGAMRPAAHPRRVSTAWRLCKPRLVLCWAQVAVGSGSMPPAERCDAAPASPPMVLTLRVQVGMRLNRSPPNIYFKKRKTGGVSITSVVPMTHMDEKMVQRILQASAGGGRGQWRGLSRAATPGARVQRILQASLGGGRWQGKGRAARAHATGSLHLAGGAWNAAAPRSFLAGNTVRCWRSRHHWSQVPACLATTHAALFADALVLLLLDRAAARRSTASTTARC